MFLVKLFPGVFYVTLFLGFLSRFPNVFLVPHFSLVFVYLNIYSGFL